MNKEEFASELSREGFKEVVTVTREADGFMDLHTHPFEAKALILDGELKIWVTDTEIFCKAGDTFHLLAETAHSVRYRRACVTDFVALKFGRIAMIGYAAVHAAVHALADH